MIYILKLEITWRSSFFHSDSTLCKWKSIMSIGPVLVLLAPISVSYNKPFNLILIQCCIFFWGGMYMLLAKKCHYITSNSGCDSLPGLRAKKKSLIICNSCIDWATVASIRAFYLKRIRILCCFQFRGFYLVDYSTKFYCTAILNLTIHTFYAFVLKINYDT